VDRSIFLYDQWNKKSYRLFLTRSINCQVFFETGLGTVSPHQEFKSLLLDEKCWRARFQIHQSLNERTLVRTFYFRLKSVSQVFALQDPVMVAGMLWNQTSKRHQNTWQLTVFFGQTWIVDISFNILPCRKPIFVKSRKLRFLRALLPVTLHLLQLQTVSKVFLVSRTAIQNGGIVSRPQPSLTART